MATHEERRDKRFYGATITVLKDIEERALQLRKNSAMRLAYGNDIPLWGSERLEVFHDGRWVDGKVGHAGAARGLVLWPREEADNPEYIVLTIGSLVRNVSEPVGDGTGPEE